jgi:NitT/TauT family transport system substrate-binding protein
MARGFVGRVAAVSTVVLLLAGCGGDGEDGAAVDGLTKVTVTIGATINFAAPHVALEQGFWREQGLDVDLVKQASGAPASLAGLINGDSLFAFTGGPSVMAPLSQGAPLRLVVNVGLGYSIELTARKGFLESKGLTGSSPLAQRIQALKGTTLGYDVPGGSMDRFYRYLFKAYGIDPDRDVTMVSLKSADVELAALQRGDIDIMAGSPPVGVTAESDGIGELYVRPTEVPGLNSYPYLIGSTSASALRGQSEAIKGLVKGLQQALDFIQANPVQAKAIVRKGFPDMSQSAFDSAFQDVLKVMPPSPLITPESFTAMTDFEADVVTKDPDKFRYEDVVAATLVDEALGELK